MAVRPPYKQTHPFRPLLNTPLTETAADGTVTISPPWARWLSDLKEIVDGIAGVYYGTNANRLLAVNAATNYQDGALWMETDTGNMYQNQLAGSPVAATWVKLGKFV